MLQRGTEFLDLEGRMVVPGFQDAHVHPSTGGLNLLRCDLAGDADRRDYVDTIRRYADAHPDRIWILGGGWGMDRFPNGIPTREELDAAVADRPVFLVNRDGHGAWVNSKALELAGIHRNTADPADGRIERDAGGEPIGCLQEGAMDLVERVLPETTEDELQRALAEGQRHLLSLGVTAWQDAWVTPVVEKAYRALASNGMLKARVVGALWALDPALAQKRQFPAVDWQSSYSLHAEGTAPGFAASMASVTCRAVTAHRRMSFR